jgi:hypothetical protein
VIIHEAFEDEHRFVSFWEDREERRRRSSDTRHVFARSSFHAYVFGGGIRFGKEFG